MSKDHQIRLEGRKTLVDGQIVCEITLTEWDEEGEYGTIAMNEKTARTLGRVLRTVSVPDPRLSRRVLREFLQNPVDSIYTFFHTLWRIWRGEE